MPGRDTPGTRARLVKGCPDHEPPAAAWTAVAGSYAEGTLVPHRVDKKRRCPRDATPKSGLPAARISAR
jgi:hypothetical protein